MPDNNRVSLLHLRLEQAHKSLSAAELLFDAGAYKDAANRSYYAIFQAMRAVLALDCFDSKKHSGIISEFDEGISKREFFQKSFLK